MAFTKLQNNLEVCDKLHANTQESINDRQLETAAPSSLDIPAKTPKLSKPMLRLPPFIFLKVCHRERRKACCDGDHKKRMSEMSNKGGSSSISEEDSLKRLFKPVGHGGIAEANLSISVWTQIAEQDRAPQKQFSRSELDCLGLPNLKRTCYMNSILQALLSLDPFVQEVHNQERVWRCHPNSEVMRAFVRLSNCRLSYCREEKKSILTALKQAVAGFNSEFLDDCQKDAHEFLCSVLQLITSQSGALSEAANHMGVTYNCPVNTHIAFQMLSTRTCIGCGCQSTAIEDFYILPLDLLLGGSVRHSLQDYLKEKKLDYNCTCGAKESTQRTSFKTLPNVLILQLKRFSFVPFYQVRKEVTPVVLSPELKLSLDPRNTKQVKTKTCYSLVSIISHLGSQADAGHYICDSACRQTPEDLDCWLTYNDDNVFERHGNAVRHRRQQIAYLLFYQKMDQLTTGDQLRQRLEHRCVRYMERGVKTRGRYH